jgi:hypothetical protein
MGQRRPRNSDTPSQLTERQAYWLKQLHACDVSGLTSQAYAKKHRLSVHALYQARKELRRRESRTSSPNRQSVTFAKVRAEPGVARGGLWRVRFPNGSLLEIEAPREPGERVHLLQALAGLS